MPTFLKGLLLSLIAAASFVVVAKVQHAMLGHAEGDLVGVKLDFIGEHPGEYDTFFLGSSTIFRQVVPAVFDEVMQVGGQDTRSYNLGSPGMAGLESDYALARLLDTLGSQAEGTTIYYEPRVPVGTLFDGLSTTERTISWHDLKRTRFAYQLIAESKLEGRAALDAYIDAGRCYVWNTTNYAQGPRLLKRFAPWLLEQQEQDTYLRATAGYQALEDSTSESVIQRGRAFAADYKDFKSAAKSVFVSHQTAPRDLSPDSVSLAIARDQVESAEEAGATLIGLVPPTIGPMAYGRSVAREYHGFFLYNSPKETPVYFRATSHFDKNHLNREQSLAFSRQLAKDVLSRAARD